MAVTRSMYMVIHDLSSLYGLEGWPSEIGNIDPPTIHRSNDLDNERSNLGVARGKRQTSLGFFPLMGVSSAALLRKLSLLLPDPTSYLLVRRRILRNAMTTRITDGERSILIADASQQLRPDFENISHAHDMAGGYIDDLAILIG